MSDLVFVILTGAFFALASLIVKGVERLWASRTPRGLSSPSSSSATSWPPFCSRSVS